MPDYTALANGAYRDALELAKAGLIEEANNQNRIAHEYAILAIEAYRKGGAE